MVRDAAPSSTNDFDDDTPVEAKLLHAVLELAGGVAAWRLADARFGEGRTLRELAERDGQSPATIKRRTDRAWSVAERYRLLPGHWHRYPSGRNPRRAIRYTGSSPDRAATGQHRGRTGQSIVTEKNV